MHRFTMEELKTWSDRQILRIILMDRQESLTNPYSPYQKRYKNYTINYQIITTN